MHVNFVALKPNSITLVGSKLAWS